MAPNIVLIGHGYWGKNIARNLDDLDALYGVCETDDEQNAIVAEKYPDARRYARFDAVLDDDAVDAVAISTPAKTHADLALRALQAGKDVFVEKPLALRYEDGQRVAEAAHTHGRILMVGHLLEYHPAVERLYDLVADGELGDIQYIYSNRLNLGRFRREENILWSFAPHDIAVILRLTGTLPIEVIATGGAYLQANVADVTVTNLHFPNSVRAHIFVSWLHPHKEQRLVIVGSDKMAVFNDRAPAEEKLVLHDRGADWVDNRPVPRKGEGTPIAYPHREPLRAEMQHFIACLEERTVPTTDAHNGLQVLEVLQAAQRSLQTGGNRVAMPQNVRALAL